MASLTMYAMMGTILFLAVGFILYTSSGSLGAVFEKASAGQTCKSSVLTHAKLKMKYSDFSSSIRCPTIKLKIDTKNQEKAKTQLANAMHNCWSNFDRGKPELFSDDNIYCTICTRVTLGKSIKIDGFTEFLRTKSYTGEKISYMEYLTPEKTDQAQFLQEFENMQIADSIDGSKTSEYAVVFTYIKGKEYLDEYLHKAADAAPGAGTAIAGTAIFIIGGIKTGGILFIIGGAYAIYQWVSTVDPFEHIALVSFVPYDPEHLGVLNCKSVPIRQ